EKKKQHGATSNECTVVAFTQCRQGILGTYMAAQALRVAAHKQGVTIAVEVKHFDGVSGQILPTTIANAHAAIVVGGSGDDRLLGKPVLYSSVNDCIRNAERLIVRAKEEDAPTYESQQSINDSAPVHGSIFGWIHHHLTYASTKVFPFFLSGCTLIFLSYLFGVTSFLSTAADYHPFSELLMSLGLNVVLALGLPIFSGNLARSIAGRHAFAPGVICGLLLYQAGVGLWGALLAGFVAGGVTYAVVKGFRGTLVGFEGIKQLALYPVLSILLSGIFTLYFTLYPVQMLAQNLERLLHERVYSSDVFDAGILSALMNIDFGGIVSKIAFSIGSSSIQSDMGLMVASITVASMSAPIGIGLSALLFKTRFSYAERVYAIPTILFGMAFLPESVIPFALKDPLRIMFASILGGVCAGISAYSFGVSLSATNGGFFTFNHVQASPIGFLLSLLLGVFVTVLALRFLKPERYDV
ncbi:MAG: fructose-specific PTS transporter subunit EIIC, partial [Bacilli bacterium]